MVSPMINGQTNSRCTLHVQFAHLDVKLEIWIKTRSREFLLFSSRGQSKQWTEWSIQTGTIAQPFQIEFRAVHYETTADVHTGQTRDDQQALVRNVKLTECGPAHIAPANVCQPNSEFRCHSGQCVPADARCDLTFDCDDWSDEDQCDPQSLYCDFTDSLCSLNTVGRLQLQSIDSGQIAKDHTSLTVLFSASVPTHLEMARNGETDVVDGALIGLRVGLHTSGCQLRFYYQAWGVAHKLELIYMVFGDQVDVMKQSFEIQSNPFNWKRQSVELYAILGGRPSKMKLVAQLTADNSLLAIDDLTMSEECYPQNQEALLCSFDGHPAKYACPAGRQTSTGITVNSVQVDNPLYATISLPSELGQAMEFAFNESQREQLKCANADACTASWSTPMAWVDNFENLTFHVKFAVHGQGVSKLTIREMVSGVELFRWRGSTGGQLINPYAWLTMFENTHNPIQLGVSFKFLDADSRISFKSTWLETNTRDGDNAVVDAMDAKHAACDFEVDCTCHQLISPRPHPHTFMCNLHQHVDELFDHTIGGQGGAFLFAKAGQDGSNQPYVLWLKPVQAHREMCITFWFTNLYRSNDRPTGKLRLLDLYSLSRRVLFTASSPLDGRWTLGKVNIKNAAGKQLAFHVEFGDNQASQAQGTWAVDDLKVEYQDCAPVDCDFDHGHMCDWNDEPTQVSGSWIWHEEKQPDNADAPVQTHMRTWFHSSSAVRRSRVVSPTFMPVSPVQCLRFYYQTGAHSSIGLVVSVGDVNDEQSIQRLVSTNGLWKEVELDVVWLSMRMGQSLMLTAMDPKGELQTNTVSSHLAVDLIRLSSRNCSQVDGDEDWLDNFEPQSLPSTGKHIEKHTHTERKLS